MGTTITILVPIGIRGRSDDRELRSECSAAFQHTETCSAAIRYERTSNSARLGSLKEGAPKETPRSRMGTAGRNASQHKAPGNEKPEKEPRIKYVLEGAPTTHQESKRDANAPHKTVRRSAEGVVEKNTREDHRQGTGELVVCCRR